MSPGYGARKPKRAPKVNLPDEGPAQLRERVTPRGGTTAATIETLGRHAMQAAFVEPIGVARCNATETRASSRGT
ncbi:pyrroline-5-carboxylate reductase dimerization domain-containing protein [Sorangium sp. So ce363]|uniref:pyrroline-5-carboxylate reductase dimerization domain-containing protein n=1 Tax=Sorangium sp. So ce363 TaxID=3133304 RepID=UPI003F5FADE5